MTYVVQRVGDGLKQICNSGKNPIMTPQYAPMCKEQNQSQDGHTTAGLETYTTLKFAPIPYVVQKRKGKANQNKPTAIWRDANRGYAKPTRGNETRQVCGQVVKTEQAKPGRRGKQNHHNFSA